MTICSNILPLLLIFLLGSVASATVFTLQNHCAYTVWPGILSGNGPTLGDGGFALAPGASAQLTANPGWSGRFWARTGCNFDNSGKGKCVTGDCGSLQCVGGGTAPVTLVEFTIATGITDKDFYDVSLVDGYNLPMMIVPQDGTGGNCNTTGCSADLNTACPAELKIVDGDESVACKSACEAFGDPQYCCSGAYASPATCKPSSYSEFFKTACPRAYSYAYDDGTSTFTCASADYLITFCPLPSASVKSTNGQIPVGQNPVGQIPVAVAEYSAGTRSTSTNFIAGFVVVTAAIWRLGELYMTLLSH